MTIMQKFFALLFFSLFCTLRPLLPADTSPPVPPPPQETKIDEPKSTEKEEEMPAKVVTPPTSDKEEMPAKVVTPLTLDEEEKEKPEIEAATQSYEWAFIKTIVILVALLALVILTIWTFKKISHGRLRSFNYVKSIKILEKRPLSPKSMLYLIEVQGKQILIAESQLEVKTLTTIEFMQTEKDL